jgi:hypothetical protein
MEWLADYQLEPWGEFSSDIRTAMLAATMANIWRSKNSRKFNVADFMPEAIEKRHIRLGGTQTPGEIKTAMETFAAAMDMAIEAGTAKQQELPETPKREALRERRRRRHQGTEAKPKGRRRRAG